jgi:hypothetical protein
MSFAAFTKREAPLNNEQYVKNKSKIIEST